MLWTSYIKFTLKTRKLIFIVSFLIFSCGENEKVEITKEEYNKLKGVEVKQIDFKELTEAKVVIIDNCEYIQFHTYYNEAITHKGNCKFCAKRLKNETEVKRDSISSTTRR